LYNDIGETIIMKKRIFISMLLSQIVVFGTDGLAMEEKKGESVLFPAMQMSALDLSDERLDLYSRMIKDGGNKHLASQTFVEENNHYKGEIADFFKKNQNVDPQSVGESVMSFAGICEDAAIQNLNLSIYKEVFDRIALIRKLKLALNTDRIKDLQEQMAATPLKIWFNNREKGYLLETVNQLINPTNTINPLLTQTNPEKFKVSIVTQTKEIQSLMIEKFRTDPIWNKNQAQLKSLISDYYQEATRTFKELQSFHSEFAKLSSSFNERLVNAIDQLKGKI
jgi:hypothetical protein